MFREASTLAGQTLSADLVVVGSGAAGLTIAQAADRAGATVIVLETGGLEHDPARRGLDRGEWIGDIGVGIASRKRFLGGSTNCWGGNCAPMDPIGYEQRPWVPHSGWPIDADDLAPWVADVHELLRVPFDTFDVDDWRERLGRVDGGVLVADSDRLETKIFQRSRVARLGELLRRELDRSPNTQVLMNGHVVELLTDAAATTVTGLRVVPTDGSPSEAFTVTGTNVVLAAAIENSRLLLASRRDLGGLGNRHDQVGRFFMGHFHFVSGRVEPADDDFDPSLYTIPGDVLGYVHGTKLAVGALRVSPAEQRRAKILDTAAFLLPYRPHEHWVGRSRAAAVGRGALARARHRDGPSWGWRDAAEGSAELPMIIGHGIGEASRRLRGHRWFGIRTWAEQAPDPDNRIMLDPVRVDRFGVPRVMVQSNLTELDRHTLKHGQQVLAEEFERVGLGRVVDELPALDRAWPRGATGTSHFMGGTRMHDDPAQGVVDRDAKVHGVDNLYVAGASTFPASGLCMATYQLTLMARRLADHLVG